MKPFLKKSSKAACPRWKGLGRGSAGDGPAEESDEPQSQRVQFPKESLGQIQQGARCTSGIG